MPAYGSLSDLELMDLLKSSDGIAYTELYNRYSGALYVHAYNKLRNKEEAKDAVQELFTKLWSNREKLSLNSNVISYLYAAVRNNVFRIIERKGLQSSYITSILHFAEQKNSITDHLVREKMLSAMIEREIAALPAKMREVFLLSRKANLSHKEIGVQLNLSQATVKKQINNALKILRVKLGIWVYLLLLMRWYN